MKQITEDVGIDHVGGNEISRIRLIWEPNVETIDEFFEQVKNRFPTHDKQIMKGEIRIEIRKKLTPIKDEPKKKK